MIYAGQHGINNQLVLPEPAEFNLYKADPDTLSNYQCLPEDLKSACTLAAKSEFIKKYIPKTILDIYCK